LWDDSGVGGETVDGSGGDDVAEGGGVDESR
jgi:hypothetical protein